MKISKISIAFLILISFLSCTKEEFDIPLDDANQKMPESTKLTSPFSQLAFKLENKTAPFKSLDENSTVGFNGMLWSITNKNRKNGRSDSQIWSSPDGKNWSLRSTNPFPARSRHSLLTYNGKMWIIGGINHSPSGGFTRDVWSTTNGLKWTRVTKSTPFSFIDRSGAVVFNERMFVFEYVYGERQKVYSSNDGNSWRLENGSAFPGVHEGKCIVFKNVLYYIGGTDPFNAHNTIWKSNNGRDWSKDKVHLYPKFSERYGHSAVAYKGKVWLIGGKGWSSGDLPMNDIWYSSNMRDWYKYSETVKFKPLFNHTSVAFKNKIYILGGKHKTDPFAVSIPSKEIWSIGSGHSIQ